MFKGCYTALITPFDEQLNIDFQSWEKLVVRQINSGVDGIVVLGTTGESPTIDEHEFEEVLKFFQQFKKDIQIIVGIGTNDTRKVLKKAKVVMKYGFENVLVVVPYYNKPNETGMYKHFSEIARTGLNIMVYDVPSRTGKSISTEVLLRLRSEFKNITSLKYANPDLDKLSKHIISLDEEFKILSGDDNLTLPMMSLGAVGVVSVASNIFPNEVSLMVRYALENNFYDAMKIHFKLYKAFKNLFIETNPIPTKYILYRMGLIGTPLLRPPLDELSENSKRVIEDELISGYALSNR